MDPAAAATATATTEDEVAPGEALGEEARAEVGHVETDEQMIARVQRIIAKVIATQSNPHPLHLHALATMLEEQESRYVQESGSSSVANGRSSHIVGRLGSLVRESDDFYECISSKFLLETRYSAAIKAAAARLLLSCSSTWMYPHVFDDAVLDNIKSWVMEEALDVPDDVCKWRRDLEPVKFPSDSEMLRTYATGLLAISLAGGIQLVDDLLTSGLSAKLMRYLRLSVFGEANISQKDASFSSETKHAPATNSTRGRDDTKVRVRQGLDSSCLDGVKIGDEGFLGDPSAERDRDRVMSMRQARGEEFWGRGSCSLRSELNVSSSEDVDGYQIIDEDTDLTVKSWNNVGFLDQSSKNSDRNGTGRNMREEDADENGWEDSSRRRANRGLVRKIVKVRINEGTMETERTLTSPGSVVRLGGPVRGSRDRNQLKDEDNKKVFDTKKHLTKVDCDGLGMEGENDDRFRDCNIGSRSISDMVKKAVFAAEAEARAAGAPAEAIKAAGDAAAELVKAAALEVWKSTNDEEAALLAASEAASTVVDAAVATEISRSSNIKEDLSGPRTLEPELDEAADEMVILDHKFLARLREKYCIQCLEILGEYVEALGPVLKEKGVDVSLALLQRSSKAEEAPDHLALLPEVLKLICALAAHRKFAALFVDRGGIQKLLSIPRVSQTFVDLSSCLFTIGSLQGIMERVCALPSGVVHQVVELALQLLECSQDQARKNAAIFFASAFVFRGVLDCFDSQEGLQKMLNLLHGAASVRSGGNAGTLGGGNPTLRNDRSPAEVLTASEKQIAYHTCVALRQYFRAHLILLVDSLRPNKGSRGVARSTSSARASYKPLDISNEAMDAVFLQIQRDRKLGPAFVRARWPAVDKFLASNGHITMLELCQAPPVERYLHDLAQYALGVLHIVTFVPYSRKLIVNATLSNDRVGMAVILDAASGAGYVDPEVIHPALNVLANLVCPPPSISNKPSVSGQGQQPLPTYTSNGLVPESRDRNLERATSDRTGESSQMERSSLSLSSGVVGDRRISLGPGAGCAGLAAQLEQGYRQAREAVRSNNGIKVLLHLLHPRMITPPGALDCIRALACRVLLGLARDETIAHILTKLQVGKKLSELIRDSGSQATGTEQARWQAELAQVAIELIAIVTNSGRASTLAATDAAAPTLRRIERAAIAAATPITYHSRELLLLIQEHLQLSGLTATAALLQKEADLTPLPPLAAAPPLLHQTPVQESSSVQLQWPSGRTSVGFLSDASKTASQDEDVSLKSDLAVASSRKKPLIFSSSISQAKCRSSSHPSSINKSVVFRSPSASSGGSEAPVTVKSTVDVEPPPKTPLVLPMKRKFIELRDVCAASSPSKQFVTPDIVSQSPIFQTPTTGRKSIQPIESAGLYPAPNSGRPKSGSVLVDNLDDISCQGTPGIASTPASQIGFPSDTQTGNVERMTLDSLVVQYLKHQHRQCPAPITTLPPLSLLHPHICPEPSRSLNAPVNVTARVSTREFRKRYGGIHAHRRDRHFVYSRFKPLRTCRDDAALLTCLTFLGDSSRIATGSHSGEMKIFDTLGGNVLESHTCHQSAITLLQSSFSGASHLLLSSSIHDVKLWDSSSLSGGPLHSFEGCKAGRFSHSGSMFAAFASESSRREVIVYDVQTYNQDLRLSDNSSSASGSGRGQPQSIIHFSPSDTMLLWNGVLWDRRSSSYVHRFDQFTDYGGGGFHPAGNEVILNSEVWDLRRFKLLRSVPSLDQTVITFNSSGDVIYAILRRNLEDITSAVHTRRVRHPLFPAFRTIDAVNYSDIATVQVDRCVLDFATEPTDSFVGVVAMDDHEEMYSSARLYEVGRRRPTDDDSDPDDGGDTDEEDDDDNDESDADVDDLLGPSLDGGDSDSDDMTNGEDDEDIDDEDIDEDIDVSGDDVDEDGDFNINDVDFDGGHGVLEIVTEGDEDDEDSEIAESFSNGGDGDFPTNGFRF